MSVSRNRTLFHYVAPAILTNACVFMFTIVDGIFVGRGVGTDALGAVNISMPFVMMINALNMLTSIGGVTVTAIRLGRGDAKGANDAFLHAMMSTLLIDIALTIVGVGFTAPLTRLLGASDGFEGLTREYILWYSLFIIPNGLSVCIQGFCRNDGSPALVGWATAIGTALNVLLDWLFVFPLNWGLMGAAVATGISQTATGLIVLLHFLLKKGQLRIRRFSLDYALLRKVTFRGLPEMIAQFATPVTTLFMNRELIARVGDVGVNAFSVISIVSSLAMSVLFGASEGLQPLFGQSYGAKDDVALKGYYRAGMKIVLGGSMICVVLCSLFGRQIGAMFGVDNTTLGLIAQCMPRYAWGFVLAGVNTMISSYLYSTKRSNYAIVLNILRSFVLNILIVVVLSAIFGGGIIWFTFGIYESLMLIVSLTVVKRSEKFGILYK